MTEAVRYSVSDGIAVLQIASPPNNALSAKVCSSLSMAVAQAQASRDVAAIVVAGSGGQFSAGYPLGALDANRAAEVARLCIQIETCKKPVVAAVSGMTLGAGFELALSCHYRVADIGAKVGFPDVGLGILCGSGGTQRAPRLAGADVTLRLMLEGVPLSVTEAELGAFFDRVVKEDVLEVAIAFASLLVEEGLGPRRTSDRRDGFADSEAFETALTKWRGRLHAHPEASNDDILACVEASRLLPFDAGLSFEQDRFLSRIGAPTFQALRHIALAERRVVQFPELKNGKADPVGLVGVIGVGAVGAGFTVACLMAGLEVVVVERNTSALEEGINRIGGLLDHAVASGRLTQIARDGIEASLHTGNDLVAVAEADFVLEASGQNTEVERQIFAQLDGVSKEGAVLAAHGASVNVTSLALETGCPEEVIGLYFSGAAHLSPGVELVVGPKSSDDTVARALWLLRRLGKVPVRVEPVAGLIGHSVMSAGLRAAEKMVLRGAHPYDIDAAMREWGMSLGPFEAADLTGLDAPWFKTSGVRLSLSLALALHRGRAAGRGWYAYDETGKPRSADLDETLHKMRSSAGLEPKTFSTSTIQGRVLAAMANAGVGLLRKGVVRTPSDIDVALVHGCGFPRWRGGPMMAAELEGLVRVRTTLRAMQAEGDSLSAPDPVFDHLIKNGGHLAR
ncbi:3-hydroxyacyl-CoA dehydrogenase [Shimia isoporae]|uniref:3-hydroxyacyl-CoA dehydrogenase n=1 Tax=Shimia isoporae TaxID=647720 RepID=A0A4R1NVE6_9RHOB|nr:3-hydroxyacyl-CoA dehydrogenase NAD-binding domain-containing protein [Shimia isoporae]TCL09042.1 3-hydroxyacyl-CoA dehydrogenase [Shimia isoporae]